jgi:hypothetical protein
MCLMTSSYRDFIKLSRKTISYIIYIAQRDRDIIPLILRQLLLLSLLYP